MTVGNGPTLNRRSQMLEGLGIGPQWVRRQTDAAPAVQSGPSGPVPLPAADTGNVADNPDHTSGPGPGKYGDSDIAAMDWDALQTAVTTCTRCSLCQSRTRTVFGVGDPQASWLFIGEGPGRSEDQQGEPFVGPAGKLLDNMLASMALRRDRDSFIANVVKCRPTDASGKDRAPNPEEIAACRPYLARQIDLIKPSILVALGKTAAVTLLDREPTTAVSSLRGVVHNYGALPLIVTYHPAYLLRTLVDKRKSWEDLCLAMDQHASPG